MTIDEARQFAAAWIEAWNEHDLGSVLAHYADDVEFLSPRAAKVVGDGRVSGKAALETYWRKGLAQQPSLRFVLDVIRVGHDSLTILYRNHRGQDGAETFEFDKNGKVIRSYACYLPAEA